MANPWSTPEGSPQGGKLLPEENEDVGRTIRLEINGVIDDILFVFPHTGRRQLAAKVAQHLIEKIGEWS